MIKRVDVPRREKHEASYVILQRRNLNRWVTFIKLLESILVLTVPVVSPSGIPF